VGGPQAERTAAMARPRAQPSASVGRDFRPEKARAGALRRSVGRGRGDDGVVAVEERIGAGEQFERPAPAPTVKSAF